MENFIVGVVLTLGVVWLVRLAHDPKGDRDMAAAAAPLALQIISIIATAEPAIIQAIHNLISGTGTMDDLKVLKADTIAWQALADHAAQQIAAIQGTQPPTPITQ